MSTTIASLGILVPAAAAAPGPVDPIEIDQGSVVGFARVFVSPNGEQLISYRKDQPLSTSLGVKTRAPGSSDFGQLDELTRTPNFEVPDMVFDPQGKAFAIWGSGPGAESSVRPPLGPFEAARPAPECGRFVDAAISPTNQVAVTCSFSRLTDPPNTFRFNIRPDLDSIAGSSTDVIPYVYDTFIQPTVAWGPDGTMVTAARHVTSTASPPPIPETRAIRAYVRDPGGVIQSTQVATAVGPADINYGGVAVTTDGTVLLSTGNSGGARVFVRQPGPASPFVPTTLSGDTALQPFTTPDGSVHVMTVENGGSGSTYRVHVRPPGGSFGPGITIPVAGGGYVPFADGFLVAPDGTEYAVVIGVDGIYVTTRAPGAAAFLAPQRIGERQIFGNPSPALTSDGDLLLAWTREVAPGDQRLVVGGLDSGKAPELSEVDIPARVLVGGEAAFSAEARDQMGVRSVSWNFGDGTTVDGRAVNHSFAKAGTFDVTVTATDRAGNQASSTAKVEAFDPTGGGPDTPKPATLKLTVPKKMKFKVLAKKGLKVKVRADRPVRIKARIGTSAKKARRKPMATKSVKAAKVTHTFRIKPKKRKLGKRRAFKLHVQVTGTTPEGDATTATKSLKITKR